MQIPLEGPRKMAVTDQMSGWRDFCSSSSKVYAELPIPGYNLVKISTFLLEFVVVTKSSGQDYIIQRKLLLIWTCPSLSAIHWVNSLTGAEGIVAHACVSRLQEVQLVQENFYCKYRFFSLIWKPHLTFFFFLNFNELNG